MGNHGPLPERSTRPRRSRAWTGRVGTLIAVTSIVDVEQAIGQTVIDALINSGLNSLTATPIIYHGVEPDDCCPEPGGAPRVIVWWDQVGFSRRPVKSGAGGNPLDCGGGGIMVDFGVRLLCCWPTPDGGLVRDVGMFADTAGYLARAAFVGYNALSTKFSTCADGKIGLRTLFSPTLGVKEAWLYPAKPRLPKGGCAGVDWKLGLVPHGTDTIAWMLPDV